MFTWTMLENGIFSFQFVVYCLSLCESNKPNVLVFGEVGCQLIRQWWIFLSAFFKIICIIRWINLRCLYVEPFVHYTLACFTACHKITHDFWTGTRLFTLFTVVWIWTCFTTVIPVVSHLTFWKKKTKKENCRILENNNKKTQRHHFIKFDQAHKNLQRSKH